MEEPHGDGDSDGEQHVTYCDVETIFADKCLRCHSDGGDLSVPFNLGTYDEAQARLSHIKPAVEDGFMPFDAVELDPPVEDLTEEERHMIIDWVDAGGPSGGCE